VQLMAPPPVTPATAAPATVIQNQASVNVVVSGVSASGSEFFDPGADTGGPGFLSHIASLVSGGVTVNSVTFNSPTQITLNISTVGTPAGAKDVTVTNPDGQSATGVGILTVSACPSITVDPATVPAGTAGSAYSQTFTQTGGTPPVTFGLAGTLPAGLTFNAGTATLSGTPTQTGSFPFTVSATDANGCGGSRDYTLVIDCATVTVNPATVPNGTAGSPYSQTFTQSGGVGTITWSLTGTLPTGLSFDTATGVLSGTPTQTGSFPITVTATDVNGCFGRRAYTLVVDCQTISVDPATIPNGTAGSAYSQTFTHTGGIGTVTFALTGTLPTGLSFDTATGVLSGTPTQLGTFNITVTATDANGCPGSRAYTLAVNAAGPFVPTALLVDEAGNKVFEPGEIAIVAPSWRNDTGAPQPLTGTASLFTGPGTSTYTISDSSADYGALAAGATANCESGTGNCYAFNVSVPATRPALHWDSTYTETLSSGDTKSWTLHLGDSFTDVPRALSPYYRFIETLLHKQITGGCAAGAYCPGGSTLREQMAVFVLVAREDARYAPPACTTPVFADVPASSPFCRWIEELARRGIASGCGGGNYCPAAPVTREQMSAFVAMTFSLTLYGP
ncbi:MAG TPA: putative Ig domain-containing protein, partial [Vicinamibacteria bacterium]|nr:putative Ig domain-containing protein [Vicinamibacteria bacterium]